MWGVNKWWQISWIVKLSFSSLFITFVSRNCFKEQKKLCFLFGLRRKKIDRKEAGKKQEKLFKRNQWIFCFWFLFVCLLFVALCLSFQLIRLLVFKQGTISAKQFLKNSLFWRKQCCMLYVVFTFLLFFDWLLFLLDTWLRLKTFIAKISI